VDDIEAAARALEARGVRFEQPAHVVARLPHADLWMAFLRDPDGHLLAIMSEVARA
jgi:methylmalonyl-CoA/ethylmalonyl-CoA epimerase